MSILRKGLVFIVFNLVVEIAFVSGLIYMQQSLERELKQAEFQQNVLLRLNEILKLWQENTIELLRYTIEGNQFTTVQQKNLYLHTRSEATELARLLKDDAVNGRLISEVREILDAGFPLLQNVRDTYFQGDLLGHLAVFKKLYRLSDLATFRVERILGAYRESLNAGLDRQERLRNQIKFVLAVGIVFNLAMSLLAAWLFFRTIAARLSILQKNMLRFASSQPLLSMKDENDEIGKLYVGFKDMAAAVHQSNQQRFEVLENARDLICSIGPAGAFVACNSASASILGYESDELLGRRLASIVEESNSNLAVEVLKLGQSGEEVKPFELRMRKKDGQVVELLWSVKRSTENQNLFCVAYDVTQKRQLERMKQEFMLMVSHDLRSPLMSVHGVLTLLREGVIRLDQEKGRARLNATISSVDRLMRLIADLLDVQKMEEGRLDLVVGECFPDEIVNESIRAVAALADEKEIAISYSVSENLPFQADKDRIVQVLVNLLSNAVKFSSPESTVKVSVSFEPEHVKFSVIDEGIGVPEEKCKRIFERFGQASAHHGKSGQGFGLGLAICRELVELHRGEIGVKPGSSCGSVFWFTILRNLPSG